jgi:hypothetical protein
MCGGEVMVARFVLCMLLVVAPMSVFADTDDELLAAKYLSRANTEYESGNRDLAKKYYLQASKYGAADAHFFLYYRYNVPPAQTLYHLEQAAWLGHGEAIGALFEKRFTRPENLFIGDPYAALWLYLRHRKDGKLKSKSEYFSTLEKCVEVGPLEAKGFLIRIDEIDEFRASLDKIYTGWQLAERAAAGEFSAAADPRLALQIVCRSAEVPRELISAVDFLHEQWKADTPAPFNLCNHITSAMGGGFCGARATRLAERGFELRLRELQGKLSEPDQEQLDVAVTTGFAYIEQKADTEELHGGSGRSGWVHSSIRSQKNLMLAFFADVVALKTPRAFPDYDEVMLDLDFFRQQIMAALTKEAFSSFNTHLDVADVNKTQQKWEEYVTAAASFLHASDPSVSVTQWRAYLANERLQHLRELYGMLEN